MNGGINMIFKNFPKVDIHSIFFKKLIILIFLFLCFCIILVQVLTLILPRYHFEKNILEIAELNSKDIFSLDKIFLFSSADATNNSTSNANWDLNISQYSDIAVFISNDKNNLSNENSIKKLYLDNFKFNTTPSIRHTYYLL